MSLFFFFNDTATTEIYTLSLHDALPIWPRQRAGAGRRYHRRNDRRLSGDRGARRRRGQGVPQCLPSPGGAAVRRRARQLRRDRKSTRLNSSHLVISYAVFCLKKKKTTYT